VKKNPAGESHLKAGVRLAGTVRKESMLRTKETAGPDNAGPAEELLERLEVAFVRR